MLKEAIIVTLIIFISMSSILVPLMYTQGTGKSILLKKQDNIDMPWYYAWGIDK